MAYFFFIFIISFLIFLYCRILLPFLPFPFRLRLPFFSLPTLSKFFPSTPVDGQPLAADAATTATGWKHFGCFLFPEERVPGSCGRFVGTTSYAMPFSPLQPEFFLFARLNQNQIRAMGSEEMSLGLVANSLNGVFNCFPFISFEHFFLSLSTTSHSSF